MPVKRTAQTVDEMMTAALEKKKSALYRRESAEFTDEQLAGLIHRATDDLMEAPPKVNLADTARVKEITKQYLMACETASIVPSITGLANALGCTRAAIYDVINRRSPAETAEFFTRCHDTFSDLLSQSALRGATQPIASIFLLKSLFGLRESVELIATTKESGPLGPEPDMAALEAKLQDVVVEDD